MRLLFVKPGCSACDELKTELERGEMPQDVRLRSLDTVDGLMDAAATDVAHRAVPVLVDDDGRVTEGDAIRDALGLAPRTEGGR